MLLSITIMAMSALSQSGNDIQFNLAWAELAFADNARLLQPGRAAVLYEDSIGDTKFCKATAGGPIRLGGKTYEHGIGVNAHSVIRVILPQPGKSFHADIGLDRNVDNTTASVGFHIEIEGRLLFTTGVIRPGEAPLSIEVPLEGAQIFDLIVDHGGDGRSFDQANWADARVLLSDASVIHIDELVQEEEARVIWPFSFVYDGKPSHTLLPSWWRQAEVESTETGYRRSLVFTDPVTHLELRAVVTTYTDSPGVDWTIHFTNKGRVDTPILEQVRVLDASFACDARTSAMFHSLRSTGGVDDWLPFSEPVPPGRVHAFAPHAGRSSMGACPFFNVQWNGGGAMVGIGWTGQWTAVVENRDGTVTLQAGMQNLHTTLHPGESIRTPRILLMRWSGEDEVRAYNLWRDTMFRHILPRVRGEVAVPPIAHLSTAFYEMDHCTEAIALAHLDAGKGLGFECFWYDAYYGKDDFPVVGNYVLPVERGFNTSRFPNGLKPIAEAVHGAGLQFLMWFEPERICPGTLMAIEHPEWVVMPEDGGWGMFNLAIPEARRYITDYIGGLIDAYGLNWVRIDNAVSYKPLWQKLDTMAGSNRVGMAEIRYVEGLYRWWDDMLATHPDIAIDNCASGGGRIDLELCSRAIPLWRTDATIGPLLNNDLYQAALQNQVMTAGLSRYVPFNTSGQMGADPYCFRSGFNGGISFCEDTRPDTYPRETLRAAIAEGKRIRKYYFGNMYALTELTTSPRDWCVLQYHRPAEGDGMLLAFRRHQSPYTGVSCKLREIDPEADYELTFSKDYTPVPPRCLTRGSDLQDSVWNISEAPGSILLEYRLVPK